jgi:abelson tyrosine-protein kinase 1/abelson tyrosine-protein kinase 2
VFSSPRNGQKWGRFSIDPALPPGVVGPAPDDEMPSAEDTQFAQKVSVVGSAKAKSDTILLARLRFKPDVLDPTSL